MLTESHISGAPFLRTCWPTVTVNDSACTPNRLSSPASQRIRKHPPWGRSPAAASKSLVFMVITDSLSWGIIGFPILGNLSRLNIHARVNVNDKGYHKAYKRFLARLVRARREAGLTQVEVAKRLGKAHSFVSKCELGERRVDFVELQQLAKIYRKDLSFFCD